MVPSFTAFGEARHHKHLGGGKGKNFEKKCFPHSCSVCFLFSEPKMRVSVSAGDDWRAFFLLAVAVVLVLAAVLVSAEPQACTIGLISGSGGNFSHFI